MPSLIKDVLKRYNVAHVKQPSALQKSKLASVGLHKLAEVCRQKAAAAPPAAATQTAPPAAATQTAPPAAASSGGIDWSKIAPYLLAGGAGALGAGATGYATAGQKDFETSGEQRSRRRKRALLSALVGGGIGVGGLAAYPHLSKLWSQYSTAK